MAGFTNRGKYYGLVGLFNRSVSLPTSLYAALCTSTVTPTAAINTLGQLEEIAAGNGYTAGGVLLTPNNTNFPIVEDDGNGKATITVANIVFTATSGGPIPGSGLGAYYLVVTDDNATVSLRNVYFWVELPDVGSGLYVTATQSITISNQKIEAS
jgi:hypothetical protein